MPLLMRAEAPDLKAGTAGEDSSTEVDLSDRPEVTEAITSIRSSIIIREARVRGTSIFMIFLAAFSAAAEGLIMEEEMASEALTALPDGGAAGSGRTSGKRDRMYRRRFRFP